MATVALATCCCSVEGKVWGILGKLTTIVSAQELLWDCEPSMMTQGGIPTGSKLQRGKIWKRGKDC
jgi:hypothetical protein